MRFNLENAPPSGAQLSGARRAHYAEQRRLDHQIHRVRCYELYVIVAALVLVVALGQWLSAAQSGLPLALLAIAALTVMLLTGAESRAHDLREAASVRLDALRELDVLVNPGDYIEMLRLAEQNLTVKNHLAQVAADGRDLVYGELAAARAQVAAQGVAA